MFYSNDLLVTRGGQFNVVWLLATSSKKDAAYRKCKSKLLKTNIRTLCLELSKMFPASGKTNSFSLRTSAMLTNGIVRAYKFKIEVVKKDLIRLSSLVSSGKAGDGPAGDGSAVIDLQPGSGAGTLCVGDLQNLQLEADIEELSQSELEIRRRAVTLIEFDQPWSKDDSFLASDNLPMTTVDQLDQDLEHGSVLADPALSDASVVMPPPPVRPSGASDPLVVEVTPTVQEERKRRSPLQPAMDIANPDDMEVDQVIPPTVTVFPPEDPPCVEPGLHFEDNAVIQPPVEEDDQASFELAAADAVVAKPPPKKRRKIMVDEVTNFTSGMVRDQMDNYEVNMRAKSVKEDLVPSKQFLRGEQLLLQARGRGLGLSLANLGSVDLSTARRVSDFSFDWPQEDVIIPPVEEELLERDLLGIPDDVSEIRSRPASEENHPLGHDVGESMGQDVSGLPQDDASLPLPVSLLERDHTFVQESVAGQDVSGFPALVPDSPERVLQEGGPFPRPVFSPPQMDVSNRGDDSMDQMESMIEVGETKPFLSFLDSVNPSRKEVARMFRHLLVLEKREVLGTEQVPEEFYGAITVTRI